MAFPHLSLCTHWFTCSLPVSSGFPAPGRQSHCPWHCPSAHTQHSAQHKCWLLSEYGDSRTLILKLGCDSVWILMNNYFLSTVLNAVGVAEETMLIHLPFIHLTKKERGGDRNNRRRWQSWDDRKSAWLGSMNKHVGDQLATQETPQLSSDPPEVDVPMLICVCARVIAFKLCKAEFPL